MKKTRIHGKYRESAPARTRKTLGVAPHKAARANINKVPGEVAKQWLANPLRKIFENSSSIFCLTDKRGVYLYISPSVKKVFGYSAEELIGTRGLNVIHSEDKMRGAAVLRKLLKSRSGESVVYELRALHKNGRWRWFEVTSSNMLREPGIKAIISVFHDITERREDEERLRYYEILGQSIADAVVSTDNTAAIMSWSKGSEALYGWKSSEVVGKRAHDILQTEPVAAASHSYVADIRKKGVWEGEVIQRKKDGTRIDIYASVSAVYDRKGNALGYVAINRDITERNRGLKALSESEERYRAFISQSSEGIWRYELPEPISTKWPARKQAEFFLTYGRVAECNDAFARMHGYSKAEDLIGAPFTRFVDPKDPEHVKLIYQFINSGYRLYDAEVREFDKDGNAKYFLLNLMGVVENGKGSRAWGTKRDITERKRSENRLRESEERFRTMADQAPVMIWMSGVNGLCYWFNKGWLDYTGRAMGQEIGNGWRTGVHPEDSEKCHAASLKGFASRKPFRMEYRLRCADGSYHWIIDNGTPLFSPDGVFEGYIGTCLDINEIRIAEQRKDEFIGIASHELKTPITTIKVYLQVLERMAKQSKNTEIAGHLSKLDMQANKLTRLVSDLLDLSKIQAGKLELSKSDFNLDSLVRETADMLQRTTEFHSFKKKLESRATIHADRDRIGQVVTNLITNAVKYSPGAGKVRISTEMRNGAAVVSVQDFGIGISDDHQEKIFERFFRVEGDHERTYPGFGIGLYISAEIVKRHGGEICVESAPGKGSTFSFTIPLAKKKEIKKGKAPSKKKGRKK